MDQDEWCRYFYRSSFQAWERFLAGDLGAVHRVEGEKPERIHSEKGWIPYNNDPQGIKSLFVHRYSDTVFSRLYIPEWEGRDMDQAMSEVQDEHSLILSQVSRELFSNY